MEGHGLSHNNHFDVNSWVRAKSSLTPSSSPPVLAPAASSPSSSAPFDPSFYITPCWKGSTLLSKSAIRVKKLFHLIVADVKKQMVKTDFTPSLKGEIHGEFLACTKKNPEVHHPLDCPSNFFRNLYAGESLHHEELEMFKHTFGARIATLYLLKTRFLTNLNKALKQTTEKASLPNPNASLAKIFRKGSSSELSSLAIVSNRYSWYRPNSKIISLVHGWEDLAISEWQEIFSDGKEQVSKAYSLAHPEVGAFLLKLITQNFFWKSKKESPYPPPQPSCFLPSSQDPWMLKTRYDGDHLEALFRSHWLAQSQDISSHTPLICPEFSQVGGDSEKFSQLSCELYFLSILVERALKQGLNPVSHICQIYRCKENASYGSQGQSSLFDSDIMGDTHSFYDCIVFTITQFPSNNPQSFLINQVQAKGKKLKANGRMIILSTQKLFIPSLADRVEVLLKDLKLESALTLKDITGRGQIPPYIYILSKKGYGEKQSTKPSPSLDQMTFTGTRLNNMEIQKHPCLSLRITGNLKALSQFSIINQEFDEFFKSRKRQIAPFYHKDLPIGLSFDFHPDALVDGSLIHTTNKDTSKITHPNFLKNLIHSCETLSYFFLLEPIKTAGTRKNDLFAHDLLGISQKPEEQFLDILIFDYRKKQQPRLEFIPASSYESKCNEYGQALCSYFGLIPKVKNININIFHYFFQTPLGQQILLLSLNDGLTHLRSKISSLLVPKFFEKSLHLPSDLIAKIKLYGCSIEGLLNLEAFELSKQYGEVKKNALELAALYPWHVASLLILFDQKLTAFQRKETKDNHYFLNENFIRSLVQQATQPIYPNNQDIFINFQPTKESCEHRLYEPIEDIKVIEKRDGEGKSSTLELYTSSGLALTMHSGKNLIEFLAFILQRKVLGRKVVDIVCETRAPGLKDLDGLVAKHHQFRETIREIKKSNQQVLNKVINNQLSH